MTTPASIQVPPYLPAEDYRKLCAEINQLNNQRFLICLAGISFFAAFGWAVFPKTVNVTTESLKLVALASMLLQALLALFCTKAQVLRLKARFLAAYLTATGSSVWERDLAMAKEDVRTEKYASLESLANSLTFAVLGMMPTLVTCWMSLQVNDLDSKIAILQAFMGLATFVLWIWIVNHSNWFSKPIEVFEKKWDSILKKSPSWIAYQQSIAAAQTVPMKPQPPAPNIANT